MAGSYEADAARVRGDRRLRDGIRTLLGEHGIDVPTIHCALIDDLADLQPPERAHIPRRPSLGGPIDTVRFYVRNEGEALDAVLANLPAPVRVAGLAPERWTEDEG